MTKRLKYLAVAEDGAAGPRDYQSDYKWDIEGWMRHNAPAVLYRRIATLDVTVTTEQGEIEYEQDRGGSPRA